MSRLSRRSSTPSKKQPELSADEAFSNRFGSILFSLYNPQISPDFDPLPKRKTTKKKYDIDDDITPFESPLCSFKVKTDLKDDAKEEDSLVHQFVERSKVLVAELSKPEYNIEVSMVPYEVERVGGDRMSRITSPSKVSLDTRSYAERSRVHNGR